MAGSFAPSRYAVVVLGGLGRSPRMQYHALSLAHTHAEAQVDFIGYTGERCIDSVHTHTRIHRHGLSTPFARAPRALYLLWAPLKVLLQVLQLLYILVWVIPRPAAYLVQNPPSIPTLAVVWLAARLRRTRMIVDWHNFGYSVLEHTRPGARLLVGVARWYEQFFGRRADAHLCVTRAMAAWLQDNWGISATVLYDRPPPFFKETDLDTRHDLFRRLEEKLPVAVSFYADRRASKFRPPGDVRVEEATLFTERVAVDGGAVKVRSRPSRPALIVSATSWTADEDFAILLHALVTLDATITAEPAAYPDVVVVLTGKGPMREYYERMIEAFRLQRVHIRTLWLEAADYPRLLGAADLGVCLHTSTSGLDLPMKVVDMFGAGIPVCAVGFKCLSELVRDGENGLIFSNSNQLSEQLKTLLRGFPGEPASAQLAKLRQGVAAFQRVRWQDNWNENARPLVVR